MNTSGLLRKSGGILIKDRKFLLERHGGKYTYILPGGKLEKEETAPQALVRELQEEFRITVKETDLEPVGTFSSRAVHNPQYIVEIETFLVREWTGEIVLDSGIEGIAWVNSEYVKKITVSPIVADHIFPLLREKDLLD